MRIEQKIIVTMFLLLQAGCRVWQSQSSFIGVTDSADLRTDKKYWIRVASAESLAQETDFERCLTVYERRMSSVFSSSGQLVFIDCEMLPEYCSYSVAMNVVNGLLFACTGGIFPCCQDDSTRGCLVKVSLSEKFTNPRSFVVKASRRQWEGVLAFVWPMPNVEDSRFVHTGYGGDLCRAEYAQEFGKQSGVGALMERFCGEADAIVHGVACVLKQYENEQRKAAMSVRIGD